MQLVHLFGHLYCFSCAQEQEQTRFLWRVNHKNSQKQEFEPKPSTTQEQQKNSGSSQEIDLVVVNSCGFLWFLVNRLIASCSRGSPPNFCCFFIDFHLKNVESGENTRFLIQKQPDSGPFWLSQELKTEVQEQELSTATRLWKVRSTTTRTTTRISIFRFTRIHKNKFVEEIPSQKKQYYVVTF